MLGCAGWPCGVLEVGSWAARQRLAQVSIQQVQPGRVARLPADAIDLLGPGIVSAELVDTLARHGRRVAASARVRPAAAGWEIDDGENRLIYRLQPSADGLEVLQLNQLDSSRLIEPMRGSRLWRQQRAAWLTDDGPSAAIQQAMQTAGADFLVRLLEFDPHLVGFRLEAGGLELVEALIAAVRLLSDAVVILGGPTPTSHPVDVLEETGADYVFAGDAEGPLEAFLRLALAPNGRDRLAEIPGLAYRYASRAWHNTLPRDGYQRSAADMPAQRRSACRAVRPLTDAALLGANRLDWSLLAGFCIPHDSLYFTGGRGCPGACTFCAKLHGQEVRTKSAQQLLEEIAGADALVERGELRVSRWPLLAHVEGSPRRDAMLAWAAIYDEDFFLDRRRALQFFELWSDTPLGERYRLSVQTNPCSLLDRTGMPDAEMFAWIERLGLMVQLGAESFNDDVLRRWAKRHRRTQLDAVLDALDRTRQDYTVFQLLTDFDTTAAELVETLRLLVLEALRHPQMRIASNAYTIPLFDSETRKTLEYRGDLAGRVRHFTDYERVQPDWMDPLAAELADAIDAELQWTLMPEQRDAALLQAVAVARDYLAAAAGHHLRLSPGQRLERENLAQQAQRALVEVTEAWRTRAG